MIQHVCRSFSSASSGFNGPCKSAVALYTPQGCYTLTRATCLDSAKQQTANPNAWYSFYHKKTDKAKALLEHLVPNLRQLRVGKIHWISTHPDLESFISFHKGLNASRFKWEEDVCLSPISRYLCTQHVFVCTLVSSHEKKVKVKLKHCFSSSFQSHPFHPVFNWLWS